MYKKTYKKELEDKDYETIQNAFVDFMRVLINNNYITYKSYINIDVNYDLARIRLLDGDNYTFEEIGLDLAQSGKRRRRVCRLLLSIRRRRRRLKIDIVKSYIHKLLQNNIKCVVACKCSLLFRGY